jgi:hypothetical protein
MRRNEEQIQLRATGQLLVENISKHHLSIYVEFIINEALAEETGIHIGDGSMNIYQGHNGPCYTVVGHHINDKEYIDTVVLPLIKEVYGKNPKPRLWSQGTYGFRIRSEEIIRFKHNVLGLPLGKKMNITIPVLISGDSSLMRACIRGIADTDGSINLEKKNGKNYPRIFITNTSEPLMRQIQAFLAQEGLRIQSWSHPQKEWRRIHKIAINGVAMLALWNSKIGFHNPNHIRKAQLVQENSL